MKRSVDVTLRVALLPAPGAVDYLFQRRKLRRPPQLVTNPVARCDQPGRISRTALTHPLRDGCAGDCSRGFNHLAHTEALTIPQVVNPIALLKCMQGEDMGVG